MLSHNDGTMKIKANKLDMGIEGPIVISMSNWFKNFAQEFIYCRAMKNIHWMAFAIVAQVLAQ